MQAEHPFPLAVIFIPVFSCDIAKKEDDMGKRNPNGYGSVTKLKGNRSKPWIIKVTQYDADGNGRQVPLDYATTEEEANIILAKYNHNPWNIDRKNITLADLASPELVTDEAFHLIVCALLLAKYGDAILNFEGK